MNLQVGLASWSTDLHGQYVYRNCTFQPAIVQYHVVIEDNSISLPNVPNQGQVLELANNTRAVNMTAPRSPSTTDAFAAWLAIFVNANASAEMIPEGADSVFEPDLSTYNPMVLKHDDGWWDNSVTFSDPGPYIVSQFNELMFRGAIAAASLPNVEARLDPDLSRQQRVQATQTLTRNTYTSDLRYWAGAAVFELVTVLLILPLFWGYWELGSPTTNTLSPFNIALAFNAPLFDGVSSSSGTRGVDRTIGDTRIK